MLHADPNLEGSATPWQGLEKMLTLHHKLQDEEKASTIQTTIDNFLLINETLEFSMFWMSYITKHILILLFKKFSYTHVTFERFLFWHFLNSQNNNIFTPLIIKITLYIFNLHDYF